jgi:dipeptidase
LGEIPEAAETYNVVGNINEYGLIITESTFGGLSKLICTKETGTVDYGSLIWVTLQRTKTARDAIMMMDKLVNTYGYASTGESFSIADQNELWYMELIGKGRFEKGAVWVARKVPDGYVSGHANQARITTFPLNDPENCLYSSDVISFAKSIHLYDGEDQDFSFSDTYDPVTFSGARMCEARVWSFFSAVMGQDWSNQYLDYAMGYNLTNRMPLWVKPSISLNVKDIMQSMRNHYEGTALDMTGKSFPDVGAGAFYSAQRVSPITWTASNYPGKTFIHERPIATMVTGWNIVCESRSNMPQSLAAVMWYGMDDSSTSVHIPIYGSITRIPEGWAGQGPQDGVPSPMMTFSLNSAFYVFNLVSNFAYYRWTNIYPYLYSIILEKEDRYMKQLAETDTQALNILQTQGKDAMTNYITDFSVLIGDTLLKEWFSVFGDLFVKYRDGYNVVTARLNPECGCSPETLPYSDEWYNRIATETGDHYMVPESKEMSRSSASYKKDIWESIPKESLRSFS